MKKTEKILLVLLRLSIGWIFFYAGITKILNPQWSAEGYIKGAKTFGELYQFFLRPEILPVVNFLNEWGLVLVGLSFLLGIFVRIGAVAGVLLMILYYFPAFSFPYAGSTYFLIDHHVVYSFVLIYCGITNAGLILGLDQIFQKKS